jgi:DNA-binding transcriptional LysR family regulator
MDLDDIKTLVEVIGRGGFVKAARRLGLAKSVVSRRIARIEAELGTQLVNRTTRGVAPTDAGRELAERGKRILIEVTDAKAAVAAHRHGVAGSIRISLPLSFGIRLMAPVLASLRTTYPDLDIDASYSDTAVDLVAGRFDAAIRIGHLAPSTLVARRIAPVALILVASPDYAQRFGAPASPPDLARHECIIHSGGPDRQVWRFQGANRRWSISPRGHLRLDNGEGLLQAAEAGLGIAALPDFIASDSIKSGRLVALLKDYSLRGGAVYVVRPPGRMVTPKVRALTELMVEKFGGRRAA